jgi:hypothetical protein
MREYRRARDLLEGGELADAIRGFLNALDDDPRHIDAYFGLMEAYELTYEVYPDPELLHQVGNVLLGVRDQDLTDEQHRRADEIELRIGTKLEAAGHPPPAPGRTPAG